MEDSEAQSMITKITIFFSILNSLISSLHSPTPLSPFLSPPPSCSLSHRRHSTARVLRDLEPLHQRRVPTRPPPPSPHPHRPHADRWQATTKTRDMIFGSFSSDVQNDHPVFPLSSPLLICYSPYSRWQTPTKTRYHIRFIWS